jgi:hypothetical protein
VAPIAVATTSPTASALGVNDSINLPPLPFVDTANISTLTQNVTAADIEFVSHYPLTLITLTN